MCREIESRWGIGNSFLGEKDTKWERMIVGWYVPMYVYLQDG
jgi:hypothetical protein